MKKRVFLIVLDSVGAGQMPDCAAYGDKDCNTLKRISSSEHFNIPNLKKLGIGNIAGLSFLGTTDDPKAAVCRLAERSKGKDTTTGHWEIAGVVSNTPFPTYPNGFPESILAEFSRRTGRGVLCNKPYSGTEVIKDFGEQHVKSGDLIVYTSADSVFQIAAHEEIVPIEQLYEYCRIAREILQGEHGVARVIARPFVGTAPNYTRTGNRHDFSLAPWSDTMLDGFKKEGRDVIAVGKIDDIFCHRGATEVIVTHGGNPEGMQRTLELVDRDFSGLCFVNLVDFDMKYGHRQDIEGYAKAITEFDKWLGEFLPKLRKDDVLMITADHGCDPGDSHTDHTREYVPLLVYGEGIDPINLGTRYGFCDISATVTEWLGSGYKGEGMSFAKALEPNGMTDERLVAHAVDAMSYAYAPYSTYKVGAALLTKAGKLYKGCNIENASYSPTNCAERTAFFKAVSEGETEFAKIAVVGGKEAVVEGVFAPCGVCRQVMLEFCNPDEFVVIYGKKDGCEAHKLCEIIPYSFLKTEIKL